MVVALLSTPARAVSVLLGGSGICQPITSAHRDIAALLLPSKAQASRDVAGSVCGASIKARSRVRRHD
jgi:hypothetical protein